MSRPSTSLILGSGLAYHLRLARRGGEEKTQHFRGGPNLRTDRAEYLLLGHSGQECLKASSL